MSLINQMLEDLERRKSPIPPGDAGPIDSLAPADGPVSAGDENRAGWLRPALCGVALAAGVHLGAEGGLLAPAVITASSGSIRGDGGPANRARPEIPAAAAAMDGDAPAAAPRYGLRLDGQLVLARLARRTERPAPAAAELSPELRAEAQHLNEVLFDNPPATRAAALQPVALADADSPALRAEVERLNDLLSENPPAAGPPGVERAPETLLASAREFPVERGSAVHKVANEPTPAERADDAYRRALRALGAGRAAQAEHLLAETLALAPGHTRAREAFAAGLFNAGRTGEALEVLAQAPPGSQSAPGIVALTARIEVEQGDIARALSTLDRLSEPLTADQYAFRAALLQRLDRHTESVMAYREALSSRPERGVWWTGMGISLEAMARSGEALEAYRQAGRRGDLGAEVARFVAERVAALGN